MKGELRRALEAPRPLDDEGFTARVMQALPAPKRATPGLARFARQAPFVVVPTFAALGIALTFALTFARASSVAAWSAPSWTVASPFAAMLLALLVVAGGALVGAEDLVTIDVARPPARQAADGPPRAACRRGCKVVRDARKPGRKGSGTVIAVESHLMLTMRPRLLFAILHRRCPPLTILLLSACGGSTTDLDRATSGGTGGSAAGAAGTSSGVAGSAGSAAGDGQSGGGASAGFGGTTGASGGAGVAGAAGSGAAPLTVHALSLGDSSACAVMSDGSVMCWGAADFTHVDTSIAVPSHVPGLANVVTMSMSGGTLCAVTADGVTSCLVTPDYTKSPWDGAPVIIEGLPSPVVEVAAWGGGALGRHADGTLSTWGISAPVTTPLASKPITDAVQLSLSPFANRFCVRRADGSVTCIPGGDETLPLAVTDAADIAMAGYSVVVLHAGGSIQVYEESASHVLAAPGPVVSIAAGGPFVCALLVDGGVACGPAKGDELSPVLPAGTAKAVAVGGNAHEGFACAILVNGGVSCWGDDVSLVLGDDTVPQPTLVKTGVGAVFPRDVSTAFVGAATGDLSLAGMATAFVDGVHATPVALPEVGIGVTWVSHAPSYGPGSGNVAGPKHAYVRDEAGTLTRFEDGTMKPKDLTKLGVDIPRFVALSSVDVAVTTDALRYSFLDPLPNIGGILGNGGAKVLPLPGVSDVQVGFEHMCAMATGGVYCWGTNFDGEVSPTAPFGAVLTPTLVASDATSFCSGSATSCAIVGGSVTCWGDDPKSPSPAITSATAVTCGHSHACVLLDEGSVRCWGDNHRAQLGLGTRNFTEIPVIPLGLDGASKHVVSLRAGDYHTCAVTSDGDALCWGESHHGQSGTGVSGVGLPPKVVSGL